MPESITIETGAFFLGLLGLIGAVTSATWTIATRRSNGYISKADLLEAIRTHEQECPIVRPMQEHLSRIDKTIEKLEAMVVDLIRIAPEIRG